MYFIHPLLLNTPLTEQLWVPALAPVFCSNSSLSRGLRATLIQSVLLYDTPNSTGYWVIFYSDKITHWVFPCLHFSPLSNQGFLMSSPKSFTKISRHASRGTHTMPQPQRWTKKVSKKPNSQAVELSTYSISAHFSLCFFRNQLYKDNFIMHSRDEDLVGLF